MIDLFLDSGAFTMSTKGKQVDIKEYHKFCKKNHKYFNIIASLDDIDSWKNSLSNFEKLDKRGNYMPCFHQGEPFHLLDLYLTRCGTVALGGMVGGSQAILGPWIKNCFLRIKKFKNKKIHGFGLTNQKLMFSYPWYSLDSSTWIRTSRMGIILIPRKKHGKINYSMPPRRIQISDKGAHKNSQYSHLSNLSIIEKNQVLKIIEDKGFKLGKSKFKYPKTKFGNTLKKPTAEIVEEGLCNNYNLRDLFNISYMQTMEKTWGNKIYLAGMGAKEDQLISQTKKNNSKFRRLVSFAYKKDVEMVIAIKRGELNEKKTITKRIRKSKTRNRIKRNN